MRHDADLRRSDTNLNEPIEQITKPSDAIGTLNKYGRYTQDPRMR